MKGFNKFTFIAYGVSYTITIGFGIVNAIILSRNLKQQRLELKAQLHNDLQNDEIQIVKDALKDAKAVKANYTESSNK